MTRKTQEAALAARAADAVRASAAESAHKYQDDWAPPETLAAAADLFYSTRQERLALQRQVDVLAARESDLKHHLMDTLPKQGAHGISGHLARVSLVTKDVARVTDWKKVFARVVREYSSHTRRKDGQEDGAFALLQRRLGDAAVKDLWARGETVEGVEKYTVTDLSVNKV